MVYDTLHKRKIFRGKQIEALGVLKFIQKFPEVMKPAVGEFPLRMCPSPSILPQISRSEFRLKIAEQYTDESERKFYAKILKQKTL